jgi:hypothetical protein
MQERTAVAAYFIEVFLQRVVAGNLVLLAGFSCRRTQPAPVVCEVILHLHSDDGVSRGRRYSHNANQGAITQPVKRAEARESLRPPGKSDSDLFLA